jgi:5-deoxy-D-glucuronate isomerase
VTELSAIEARTRRLRTLTGSIPAAPVKQTLGELGKQTEQHESSLRSVHHAHDRALALQATVHQRVTECDAAIAAVCAELERVTVTAAQAERKARGGRLGAANRQAH